MEVIYPTRIMEKAFRHDQKTKKSINKGNRVK